MKQQDQKVTHREKIDTFSINLGEITYKMFQEEGKYNKSICSRVQFLVKLISFVLHIVYIGGYSGGQLGVRGALHAYFVNNLHERGGRGRAGAGATGDLGGGGARGRGVA